MINFVRHYISRILRTYESVSLVLKRNFYLSILKCGKFNIYVDVTNKNDAMEIIEAYHEGKSNSRNLKTCKGQIYIYNDWT